MAGLIYVGAVAHAFARLPWPAGTIALRTLAYPSMFVILSAGLPLALPGLSRPLSRYVWASFEAGFGQTLFSVLSGVGLLGGAAAFMYWQIATAQPGGRYPTGVFSAYAAGIGILAAQAALARRLERDPEVRARIEVGPPL